MTESSRNDRPAPLGRTADVVLVDMPGQLCNQLRLLANVLAVSVDLGFRVYAPVFRYKDMLANRGTFAPGPEPDVPKAIRWTEPLVRHSGLGKHLFAWKETGYLNISASHDRRRRVFDLEGDAFARWVSRFRRLYLAGFSYQAFGAVARNRARILDALMPADEVLHAARDRVAEIRLCHEFVLGVHVRRGDYRTYAGGRLLFGDPEYAVLVRGLLERLGKRDAGVMVCSNEPVDLAAYAGLNAFAGPGGAYEDLCALSMTDMLVGPPSTFSGWASFVGGIPKIEVLSATDRLDPAAAFVSPC